MGVSGYLTFLLFVIPLIAIIVTLFEISNLANMKMSTNRGLQEALIKVSMSPLPMGDAVRWSDTQEYLVSQGNTGSQISPDGIRFVATEAALYTTDPIPGEMLVYMEANTAAGGLPGSVRALPSVVGSDTLVPMVHAHIRYRYQFLSGFVPYFFGGADAVPSSVFETALTTVNEHPDYEQGN